ncbi:XdhC family protein [Pararhizobium antarcticum]|uniref:XdhC/CoxF family protein n=1 Tax=Pararhizobium antarcticum TaxID=1798805 RepID=A0A657LNL2_9HYPH|nr:XdhC family protein [Pararhizobium antarcticum]OJF93356.1 XdhC/CoxF family protein [Pararhizobium antarcticum]OJF96008.1 XdhC/CoxF family protein [Rhizobium sp. 58]
MKAQDLASLNAARRSRKAALSVTTLSGNSSFILIEGQPAPPGLVDVVDNAFRSGKSALVEVDGERLFLNVYLPPPRIVVIGAVHISQALAGLSAIAGFDLMVIDPRTAFATPERFTGVDLVADWPEDVLKLRPLDPYSALVAVTHDPKIDDFPLKAALDCGCFYVGALGSRKTHATRVERLRKEGVAQTMIERIAAPIGLDIGASNPPEIAVAILAEIIRAFRTRSVSTLAEGTS